MENNKQAEELYRQGLLILYQPGKDSLKRITELWQKAIELYRENGEKDKAVEIEKNLIKLHRRADNSNLFLPPESVNETVKQSQDEATGVKDFNEWSVFLKIGCFGFGGPMAVFSLLQDELVSRKKILTNNDFLEGAVLGDILPGPVTMDIVTYTGYKLKKWSGAIKASLLFILPSFIIILIIAMFYDKLIAIPKVETILKCLGAAVTGLIVSVGIKLGEQLIKDYYSVGILIWAFTSSLIFKFDILWVVLLSGVAGMIMYRQNNSTG